MVPSVNKPNLEAPPSPTAHTSSHFNDGLAASSSHVQSLKVYQLDLASQPTLYERLGGEPKIKALTAAFFEAIGKVQGLAHFFVNVPVAAIQLHQGQFFKVLFGADEEKPSADELLDYMILTHVRLFRDLGLDASHFDLVAECFIDAMIQLEVPQEMQEECLAIVGPLRVAFDYGATVAQKERTMSKDTFQKAPLATVKTMRADQVAKLPAGLEPPQQWLVEYLGGRDNVRAWTSTMTHRFVVQDETLSATFFNLPYLEMEPFCHSFLCLAFAHSFGPGAKLPLNVLRTIRFPLGLTKPGFQLTKYNYERIVSHFYEIGIELAQKDQCWLLPDELGDITDVLREKRSMFVGVEPTLQLSAVERHHRLRHDPNEHRHTSLEKELCEKEMTYELIKTGEDLLMNDFSNDSDADAAPKSNKKKSKKKSRPSEQARPRKTRGLWFFRLLAREKNNKKKKRKEQPVESDSSSHGHSLNMRQAIAA